MPKLYSGFLDKLPSGTGYLLLMHGFHLVWSFLGFWIYFLSIFRSTEANVLETLLSTGFVFFIISAPILFFLAVWATALLVRFLFQSPIYLEYEESKFPRFVAALLYFPFAMMPISRSYVVDIFKNPFVILTYLCFLFFLGLYLVSSVLAKK
jgi:hypothetical protein